MTTNEKIARWLGKDIHIGPTRDLCDGDLYRFGDAEGICIVHVTDDESHSFVGWNPEEYIEDWHGKDGLLAGIKQRGLLRDFTRRVVQQVDGIGIGAAIIIGNITIGELWDRLSQLLFATPAQLAAALVEVIGEK